MNKKIKIESFLEKYKIKDFKNSLSFCVFDYYKQFTNDENLLLLSLIFNPLSKKNLFKEFNLKEEEKILQSFYDCNENLLKNDKVYPFIVLFLSQLYCINQYDSKIFLKKENKKLLNFAFKLLKKVHLTKLKRDLEDLFFSILDKKTWDNYKKILKITKDHFKVKEEKVKKHFAKILKTLDIKGEVETRIKTIYSIHQKIQKKNLLLSQILDRIGIRLIVNSEKQCYQLMAYISNNFQIFNNKIKDYIAIPKNNEYQSIHLTIFYEKTPVEIQIRTKNMHKVALFGEASHFNYKKND
jgi:ppGpp synthetase/RelA/SpoT-type nucleotidyltranferase